MSIFIAREFSFSRDFRKIKWSATLGYNLLRSFFAGLIFGILMYFFPQSANDQSVALTIPLIWPCAYLILFVPFGLLLSFLSPFVRLTGLFSFFLALISVTLGDPIVCVIKSLFPRIVPVEEPPLFSTNLLIFVIDAPEISIASHGQEQHLDAHSFLDEEHSSSYTSGGNTLGGGMVVRIVLLGLLVVIIFSYFNSNKSTIQKTSQTATNIQNQPNVKTNITVKNNNCWSQDFYLDNQRLATIPAYTSKVVYVRQGTYIAKVCTANTSNCGTPNSVTWMERAGAYTISPHNSCNNTNSKNNYQSKPESTKLSDEIEDEPPIPETQQNIPASKTSWSTDWGSGIIPIITKDNCSDNEFLQQGYNYHLSVSIPISRLKYSTDAHYVSGNRATTVLGCWRDKPDGTQHLIMRRKKDNKITERDINLNDGTWTSK